MFHPFSIEVQNYCKILKPQRILPFLAEYITAKGLASQRTLYATLLTNNLKTIIYFLSSSSSDRMKPMGLRDFISDGLAWSSASAMLIASSWERVLSFMSF